MAALVLGLPDETMQAFKLALKFLGADSTFSLSDALEPSAHDVRSLLLRFLTTSRADSKDEFPSQDFMGLLSGYGVITDLPCDVLIQLFINHFPGDNKIILLPRSIQSLAEINKTLDSSLLSRLAARNVRDFNSAWTLLNSMWDAIGNGNLPALYTSLRVALADIGRTEASGHVLEIDAYNGSWRILCEFLDCPVPPDVDPNAPVLVRSQASGIMGRRSRSRLNIPDQLLKELDFDKAMDEQIEVSKMSLLKAYVFDHWFFIVFGLFTFVVALVSGVCFYIGIGLWIAWLVRG